MQKDVSGKAIKIWITAKPMANFAVKTKQIILM
jgi:hypothetical protein